MSMKIKNIVLFITMLMCVLSCERYRKQDVLILYPSWAEGIAITHLADVMLQEKGYTTLLKRIEPGPIFASLSRGDADIYMDAWLPYTHRDYWDRFGHRMDTLGTIFDDGITGLVVPSYVTINSIEELNEHRDQFGGNIYGIASGAGIHTNTERAIVEYDLDYQQISSSETSMLAALRKAASNEEWVVVTGWKPHFMWSMYDLKPLVDPKGVYPIDRITIVSRKGFSEDQPEVASFFNRFKLTESLLNELIDDVESDRDPYVGARLFYQKHKAVLDNQCWAVDEM